jgi:hypothetical protein
MGILNFQKETKKTYGGAYKDKWLDSYDNLYIDLNFVLHHVCYLSKDIPDLLARFKDYLFGIITSTIPKKRIIMAADGPAPLAKLILQRKRRQEMVKLLDTEVDLSKNLNLNLSPGTEFMTNIEKSLQGFINYIKEKYKVDVKLLITDSDEGEIKIKHHLQMVQAKNPFETHVVYSGDSDVILLLFACDDLTKIYQIIGKNVILSLGKLFDIHAEIFCGININDIQSNSVDVKYIKNIKNDFVFINLLMGNDYFPKVQFVKMETLWAAYSKLFRLRKRCLISIDRDQISIDPIFFHDLMYYTSTKIKACYLNKFHISDLKNQFYDDYVQGLFWCFGMYMTGKCTNYRYIYDHDSSPHITGLMLTIINNNSYKITRFQSIDVDLYGILLIPEKARKLLSKEQNLIAELLVEKYPILYEEERCKECKKHNLIINQLTQELKLISKNNDMCSEDQSENNEQNDEDECSENSKTVKKKKTQKSEKDDDVNNNDAEITRIKKELSHNKIKLRKHKEIHQILTYEKIKQIGLSFNKIRDDLRDTIDMDSMYQSDESTKSYKPFSSLTTVFKKKLF